MKPESVTAIAAISAAVIALSAIAPSVVITVILAALIFLLFGGIKAVKEAVNRIDEDFKEVKNSDRDPMEEIYGTLDEEVRVLLKVIEDEGDVFSARRYKAIKRLRKIIHSYGKFKNEDEYLAATHCPIDKLEETIEQYVYRTAKEDTVDDKTMPVKILYTVHHDEKTFVTTYSAYAVNQDVAKVLLPNEEGSDEVYIGDSLSTIVESIEKALKERYPDFYHFEIDLEEVDFDIHPLDEKGGKKVD